jgi:hypothetical protein
MKPLALLLLALLAWSRLDLDRLSDQKRVAESLEAAGTDLSQAVEFERAYLVLVERLTECERKLKTADE